MDQESTCELCVLETLAGRQRRLFNIGPTIRTATTGPHFKLSNFKPPADAPLRRSPARSSPRPYERTNPKPCPLNELCRREQDEINQTKSRHHLRRCQLASGGLT